MARPSKFNREDAVETVMNEMWRNGFAASSVKALSETLGISRSSFYNAFGSREDLFKEALKIYFQGSPDRVLGMPPGDKTIKQLISSMLYDACKVRLADPQGRGCLAINSVAELCNTHDELGPYMKNVLSGARSTMEGLLATAVERGELDVATDIHEKTLALQNLLVGLNVMCKVVDDKDDLWSIAKTTLMGLDLYQAWD
jgi:TetR/AcrR family transcriptional repressor of nem operon